jgi:hypothetical protein
MMFQRFFSFAFAKLNRRLLGGEKSLLCEDYSKLGRQSYFPIEG